MEHNSRRSYDATAEEWKAARLNANRQITCCIGPFRRASWVTYPHVELQRRYGKGSYFCIESPRLAAGRLLQTSSAAPGFFRYVNASRPIPNTITNHSNSSISLVAVEKSAIACSTILHSILYFFGSFLSLLSHVVISFGDERNEF